MVFCISDIVSLIFVPAKTQIENGKIYIWQCNFEADFVELV